MRYNGITPEMAERGTRHVHLYAVLGFLAFAVVAYVLRGLMLSLHVMSAGEALRLSFTLWIGFAVPILLGSILWEHRPVPLYLINVGYWLLALLTMSIVLAV